MQMAGSDQIVGSDFPLVGVGIAHTSSAMVTCRGYTVCCHVSMNSTDSECFVGEGSIYVSFSKGVAVLASGSSVV